ncbi:MAG: hypothetical protein JWN86_2517 [Planctomycetota bacterium]|nr:hypothetical protein [Planctomycetota bacterium]
MIGHILATGTRGHQDVEAIEEGVRDAIGGRQPRWQGESNGSVRET